MEGKKPVQKRLVEGGYEILLRWEPDSDGRVYWVDFEIYTRYAYDDDHVEYQRRGSTFSPDPVGSIDDAEIEVEGFVKWDGCTQFSVPRGAHVDGAFDLDDWLTVIRRACSEAYASNTVRDGEY